jgi:hypothetical protein
VKEPLPEPFDKIEYGFELPEDTSWDKRYKVDTGKETFVGFLCGKSLKESL